MIAWWQRVAARPVVAHLLRAGDRFGARLGSQFAAGIAYFSVVALVPVLMLCFSAAGLVLTVFYPKALAAIEDLVKDNLSGQSELAGDQIVDVVTTALEGWPATTVAGVLLGLWLGGAWIGNLKRAVRVQLRPELGTPEKRLIWPLDVAANIGMLLVLVVGIIITFAALPLTSMIGTDTITALALPAWAGAWTTKAVSLVVSLVVGLGLFWVLLRLCAVDPVPRQAVLLGSLIGAVGLAALQLLTAYVIRAFSGNLAQALFGPAIILMLFLNVFATLVLLVAAWVGTWKPRVAEPALVSASVGPVPADSVPAGLDPADPATDLRVRPEVAEHALRAGLGAGYLFGAATGAGLGALIVRLLRRR